jgi:hypothetical protein
MGIQSKGRGTAAAFGFLLLFAGIVGALVLFFFSTRRHDDAIDSFARASVGCTTTLDFVETGTFYVYEEQGGIGLSSTGTCEAAATSEPEFGFELSDSDATAVATRIDSSVSYDIDDYFGRSIARFEIDAVGVYDLVVVGPETTVVAAIGRDPDDGVDELRQGAILVGVGGVLLGLLLLILAGRRSKKAAVVGIPDGPGWGPMPPTIPGTWPPEVPKISQLPVNPHQPDSPAEVASPPPPLPERPTRASSPSDLAWAPPTGAAPVSHAPVLIPPPPAIPVPQPRLPNVPGAPSGVLPTAPTHNVEQESESDRDHSD